MFVQNPFVRIGWSFVWIANWSFRLLQQVLPLDCIISTTSTSSKSTALQSWKMSRRPRGRPNIKSSWLKDEERGTWIRRIALSFRLLFLQRIAIGFACFLAGYLVGQGESEVNHMRMEDGAVSSDLVVCCIWRCDRSSRFLIVKLVPSTTIKGKLSLLHLDNNKQKRLYDAQIWLYFVHSFFSGIESN